MTGLHAQVRLARRDFTLDVDLQFPAGAISAVFGPSGSGKTTLLRCLAGLERAAGRISLMEDCWQDTEHGQFLPTHRRSVGMVFQESALLPHLSVQANIEFGYRRTPPSMRRVTLDEAMMWTGVGHLLNRSVAGLSGGERGRVAIARALAASPRVLLLDEPLAALDRAARAEILPYIKSVRRQLDIPVIYVTHAQEEAAALADLIVYLEAGRVRASGAAADILTRLDLALAHEDEAAAVIDASVVGHEPEYGLAILSFAGGELSVADPGVALGAAVRVRISARDVSIHLDAPTRSSVLNCLPARIEQVDIDRPAQALLRLDVGGTHLLARVTRKSVLRLDLTPGQRVFALVKSAALWA